MKSLDVIDSHTGGEPTRLILPGSVALVGESVADKAHRLYDDLGSVLGAICNEPYGSDIIIGAIITESQVADYGLIFFNNVGLLGMCGHGLIGVMESLHWLNPNEKPKLTFETRVGVVTAERDTSGAVTFQNVTASLHASDVPVSLPSGRTIHGDIAWGGNWFFLCSDHGLDLSYRNLPELKSFSSEIRKVLDRDRITGANSGEIDHIELTSSLGQNRGRNFVLCPGFAYDRSPCGTGTSAKLACLAAHGELAEGEIWTQQSITGSEFTGIYKKVEGGIIPTITGRAFVTAKSTLFFDPSDPFHRGIPNAEGLP